MPHDCKNRLIETGDTIRVKPQNHERQYVGAVLKVWPGADTCSGHFQFTPIGGVGPIVEMFDAPESTLILKANGDLPEEKAEE
jgi:hypothetical protein